MTWPAFPPGRRTALPTYPFQRDRYWPTPAPAPAPAGDDGTAAPAEARLWADVSNGDLDTLAATLDLDTAQLRPVVPALAAWQHRQRRHHRHRPLALPMTWKPPPATGPPPAWPAPGWSSPRPASPPPTSPPGRRRPARHGATPSPPRRAPQPRPGTLTALSPRADRTTMTATAQIRRRHQQPGPAAAGTWPGSLAAGRWPPGPTRPHGGPGRDRADPRAGPGARRCRG